MKNNLSIIILALIISFLSINGCKSKYRLNLDDLTREPAWPFYRGELASLGAKPNGHYTGKLDILWEYKSNDKPGGPLTIYHDQLVYPGTRNKIKFINLYNGDFSGYLKIKGTPQSGLIIKDSLAYFAVAPRWRLISCINLFNGDIVWKRQVKNVSVGSIIVNNRMIIGSGEGLLVALNPLDGMQEWQFIAESKFNLPPSFGAGKLFQPGDNGIIYALSAEDGTEFFQIKLDGALVSPITVADKVYCSDLYGNVYGIDPTDGKIIWRNKLNGPIWTSIAVANGHLYIGHSGGEMVAIDAADGNIIWRFNAVDVIRSSAVVAGDYVVFGTMSGKLFSLNAADGIVIEKRQLNSAVATSPVTDGNRIYIATEKGMIICFGGKNESNISAD